MRRIYTEEESQERRRFYNVVLGHFTIEKGHSDHLAGPLDAEWLYDLYRTLSPETMLSAADIAHLLTTLGTDSDAVWLNLRNPKRGALPPNILKPLRTHLTREMGLELEGKRAVDVKQGTASAEAYVLFLKHFVKPSTRDFRVGVTEIVRLYTQYCQECGHAVLGRRSRTPALVDWCGEAKHGYADGKSGVRYVNARLPLPEDWALSVKVGLGLFKVAPDLYEDNQGTRLRVGPQGQALDGITATRINARIAKGRMDTHEEEAQESGEDKAEPGTGTADDDGRETQSDDAPTSQRTTTTSTADESGHQRSNQTTESSEVSNDRNKGTVRPERTSGCEPGGDGTSARASFNNTGTFRELGALNGTSDEAGDNEIDDTGNDTVDDTVDVGYVEVHLELDDDIDDADDGEITVADVLPGLRALYVLEPFDEAACAEYLAMLDVSFTAADIWEDFLRYIEEGG